MSIADAFAGIAIAFSEAGLGPYHRAVARWSGEPAFDDGGSIITPGTPIVLPCRAQVDVVTEAMRQQEGYQDKDVALLVLVSGLSRPIDTDAVVDVTEGPQQGLWSVQSVSLDPMATHWLCRGRRAGDSSGEQPVVRQLSGGITGDAVLYAALSLGKALSGAVAGAGAASGALTVGTMLSGAVTGASSLSGTIGSGTLLTGAIAGVGQAYAVITVRAGLSGSIAGTGDLSGSLTTQAALSGAIVAPGVVAGTITVRAALSGAVTGSGAVAGTLTNQGGAAYDPDAQTYFAAMTVQPDATRKGLLNDLIVGLKADGVWAKLDRLSIFASQTQQQASVCARNPAKTVAASNAPAFTADRGFMGDAATAFLDFGEPWAFSGANFTLNNMSLFAWCNLASSTNLYGQIGNVGALRSGISVRQGGGNNTFNANETTSTAYTASGISTGFRCINRGEAGVKRAYTNGQLITTANVTSTSASTTNGCALRSTLSYTDARLAVAGSGGNLTDAENAALFNRLSTFLTAIGAN